MTAKPPMIIHVVRGSASARSSFARVFPTRRSTLARRFAGFTLDLRPTAADFFDPILGELGSFWGSEASDPAAGSPIRVGPVSATSPELAIGMQLEFVASGLTEVQVTTGSGNTYTFSASRAAP